MSPEASSASQKPLPGDVREMGELDAVAKVACEAASQRRHGINSDEASSEADNDARLGLQNTIASKAVNSKVTHAAKLRDGDDSNEKK